MFDSAATELTKKPFFSQMLCLGGLGIYFWMSVEVSCPVRRQSGHYLPAEAPPVVVRFTLLLQALLFCCGLRHALRQSLSVVVGCLSNGRVSQLGRVASVMVDAPPPQSILGRLPGAGLKSRFCSSHWANPNALSL